MLGREDFHLMSLCLDRPLEVWARDIKSQKGFLDQLDYMSFAIAMRNKMIDLMHAARGQTAGNETADQFARYMADGIDRLLLDYITNERTQEGTGS